LQQNFLPKCVDDRDTAPDSTREVYDVLADSLVTWGENTPPSYHPLDDFGVSACCPVLILHDVYRFLKVFEQKKLPGPGKYLKIKLALENFGS